MRVAEVATMRAPSGNAAAGTPHPGMTDAEVVIP